MEVPDGKSTLTNQLDNFARCLLDISNIFHMIVIRSPELSSFINMGAIRCYFRLLITTSVGNWPMRRPGCSCEIVFGQ